MRVRVSLDFDILIESCISLCIIETALAILSVLLTTGVFFCFIFSYNTFWYHYKKKECRVV